MNRPDRTTLAEKADAEVSTVREAYLAVQCVRNFLLQVVDMKRDERIASPTEINALVAVVNAEFERRAKVAKANIISMYAPRNDG